jgi:hypothetical protein
MLGLLIACSHSLGVIEKLWVWVSWYTLSHYQHINFIAIGSSIRRWYRLRSSHHGDLCIDREWGADEWLHVLLRQSTLLEQSMPLASTPSRCLTLVNTRYSTLVFMRWLGSASCAPRCAGTTSPQLAACSIGEAKSIMVLDHQLTHGGL